MPRIPSLDLARGFTVLLITPIHTVLLFTQLTVRDTLFVKLLAFVAEWQGAQVFMLLMGISFALSPKHDVSHVAKRCFYLFLAAYLLSLVKFVIPMWLHIIPAKMLSDLQIENNAHGLLQFLLLGDILHFAAIANLVLFIVYGIKNYPWAAFACAVAACVLAPLFWDMHSRYFVIDYILQLLGGKPMRVFFPAMPWLVYPLTGLGFGHYFRTLGRQKVFWMMRDLGWVLIVVGLAGSSIWPADQSNLFYRTAPFDSLLHLGVVLAGISSWDWICINVRENYFFKLLKYCSKNITLIYIIQWPMICWLLILLPYQSLGYYASIGLCIAVIAVTLTLTLFIHATRKKDL